MLHSIRTRLGGAFLVIGIIAATLGTVATPISTANAQFNTPSAASSYGANTSSCEIETVGWVICPVMRSIAKLADYGFAFINQNFLKIEYGISNTDSGVYKAWTLMLSIANILFVLAFMWIVYAQITGKSAGGYNIKRMLPRLIIAAILVNVSYFACVIAIEVSNAVGGSILAIMQEVSDRIGPAAMTLSSAENGFDDSRLSDITSAILTKQGTVWILLAPVAAVTISIAIICAAGLVLLIMRKVVVAMLVLVSPLMFVTYLLPNTERYFQQWLRLFFQLLLLYPVIAFLLGTGQIISATIINVGSESDSNYRVRDDNYNARNGGSGSATTDLAAAGAAVLPLLGTWFLL
ncbi:type IV secretion system protein, partial [Candidatus Saccharibacteria bacterium]|nr:type IV secretion system protein [Candidatus Saccharibacteria bacterium]